MSADGEWRKWHDATVWTLTVGPVFEAEISCVGGQWIPRLNGHHMSGYPTADQAKARIDWEIWNRVRLMKDAYLKLLARKATWERGST